MFIELLRGVARLKLCWLKARLWWVQRTNPSRLHPTCNHLGCINPAEMRLMGLVRFWADTVNHPVTYRQTNWKFDPEEDAAEEPTWSREARRYTCEDREWAEEAAYDDIMDRLGLLYAERFHKEMTDEQADAALVKLCAAVKAGRI